MLVLCECSEIFGITWGHFITSGVYTMAVEYMNFDVELWVYMLIKQLLI